MTKHNLCVATYERGTYAATGKIKPYHWSYFIQSKAEQGQRPGIMHQLRGMPGNFYYNGVEQVDFDKSDPRKEEVEVGEVEDSKLDRIHEILKEIRIEYCESSGWNCQDWMLDGLEKLKEEGFIHDYLTKDALKHWLKET
jgi:hypothetical protein